MNSSPIFGVSTPESFYEQTLAMRVDPKTGGPDPQALQRFAATYPESEAFNHWAKTVPWTSSFIDETYNSLNAFIFVNSANARHAVRWTMVPTVHPSIPATRSLPSWSPISWKRISSGGLPKDHSDGISW